MPSFIPFGLAANTDYRCDNPAAPGVCYTIGHAGLFENVQRAINKMVGTVGGLTAVAVDGKIGAATASAAAKVAAYLHSQLVHAGVGSYASTLGALLGGSKEVLAQNAEEFVRVVDLYIAAKGTKLPATGGGTALPAPTLPAGLPAASSGSKSRLVWWIAGAFAATGVGALGYSVYRRRTLEGRR